MSSEWLSADECLRAGLVWQVCEPADLIATTLEHAKVLASKPIPSLVEIKRTIVEPGRAAIAAARDRENAAFARLMGAPGEHGGSRPSPRSGRRRDRTPPGRSRAMRVVDLTETRGALCGRILADLGADVVKVGPPGDGSFASAYRERQQAPGTRGRRPRRAARRRRRPRREPRPRGAGRAST